MVDRLYWMHYLQAAVFTYLLLVSVVQGFCVPSASSSTTSCSTDITLTVPRFLPDNDDDDDDVTGTTDENSDSCTYPSPLHNIHVVSLLSDDETAHCLKLAQQYAAATGCWKQPDQERHATYSTCDFAVQECESLVAYLDEIGLNERLWTELSERYGIDRDDMSYLDFFCAHYQANKEDGEGDSQTTTMDRLEPHRDGSLLSFTITLSSPDDFEGGGTIFDALRDVDPVNNDVLRSGGVVRPCRAGDAVLHSGKLLHGADVVRSGERSVLVGFVEVADWCLRPGALTTACRDWGRMDVARYRYNRQIDRTKDSERGWFLNNAKWLPQGRSRSYMQGFCPAFDSVIRRADDEYQRLKKLQAEDRLLRTILLSEDEKEGAMPLEFSFLDD